MQISVIKEDVRKLDITGPKEGEILEIMDSIESKIVCLQAKAIVNPAVNKITDRICLKNSFLKR